MSLSKIWARAHGRYVRTVTDVLFRRPFKLDTTGPFISFTFDDFPRSSLYTGGEILKKYGLRATYYASLGLMGRENATGKIFLLDDLKELFAQGHELGCHTFAHVHSWNTRPAVFEDSIIKNKRALDELVPGAVFKSFSYPKIGPRPDSKRRASRYFCSCRGGGQTYNAGIADLNLLKAFFLEKTYNNSRIVKEIIDRNCQDHGWLIFATHDISETHTQYGCGPSFFEEIVHYAKTSGATILPVIEALKDIALHSRAKTTSEANSKKQKDNACNVAVNVVDRHDDC